MPFEIMLEKDYDTVEEAVRDSEREIGIRQGFLEPLHKEDDWSFIIKSHAFFEAAFTHLLVALTEKQEELGDVFSCLELSNARSGDLTPQERNSFARTSNTPPSRPKLRTLNREFPRRA